MDGVQESSSPPSKLSLPKSINQHGWFPIAIIDSYSITLGYDREIKMSGRLWHHCLPPLLGDHQRLSVKDSSFYSDTPPVQLQTLESDFLLASMVGSIYPPKEQFVSLNVKSFIGKIR